jgi:hypothetical protein
MSNERNDAPDATEHPEPDLGEQVDASARTIKLNRSDVMASLRVPGPDDEDVDELETTAEIEIGGRLAEQRAEPAPADTDAVTPHLGEEVDPNTSTITLDAAAIEARLAERDE